MQTRIGSRSARWAVLGAALVACGMGAALASAGTFAARETHRGLVVDLADGTTARLMSRGWFGRSGEPIFTYRAADGTVAGVWQPAPDTAVVRAGTTEGSPLIGRIVPSWDDNALRLTIEPAAGAPVRTTVFTRDGGGSPTTLTRNTSTRGALAGSYRAILRSEKDADVGWLKVDVDADGATTFTGDLPSSMPPALAAAAAAAVDGEVSRIYDDVIDVAPLRR